MLNERPEPREKLNDPAKLAIGMLTGDVRGDVESLVGKRVARRVKPSARNQD